MEKKEIEAVVRAYWGNYNQTYSQRIPRGADAEGADVADRLRHGVATTATVIDYLRGDIEGLPSPLSELARNNADSSCPAPPPDNGDPSPLSTEVMKCLGSLGLQSLKELKGYKYDDKSHILLHVNGRLADSGWLKGDPHLCELERIMAAEGTPFPLLP